MILKRLNDGYAALAIWTSICFGPFSRTPTGPAIFLHTLRGAQEHGSTERPNPLHNFYMAYEARRLIGAYQ